MSTNTIEQYGITLVGKAVPRLEPADSRSQFIKAFHNLLHRTAMLLQRRRRRHRHLADAFPVLNALKEAHIYSPQGAHNQFGDLPWTARMEMLNEAMDAGASEMRDFLRADHSVPYQESWMGPVDT